MTLPLFKYHPDPLRTEAIVPSSAICGSCGQSRGFVYDASFYAIDKPTHICPWCIEDGTAAKKYDGTFSDGAPLSFAGISREIIEEVTERTPGYTSWQQEDWMTCCKDACAFHGDVTVNEMQEMTLEAFRLAFHGNQDIDSQELDQFKKTYRPKGNPSIYKWVCLHCQLVKYQADYT